MTMVPYVVRQGDYLPKIAARMGFDANSVWNTSANADLRFQRKDWHMLCPGDVLYVPPPTTKWMPVTIGSLNRFVGTVPTVALRAVFRHAGKALSGAACTVHGLPEPNQFLTDADGKLTLRVPVAIDAVIVEFSKPHLLQRLRVGHLDPIGVPSGVYQRLRNLGVNTSSGPLPADFDEGVLSEALGVFQSNRGLEVTGIADDATTARLRSEHGC